MQLSNSTGTGVAPGRGRTSECDATCAALSRALGACIAWHVRHAPTCCFPTLDELPRCARLTFESCLHRRRTRASASPADTFADIMQMCHAVRGRLPRLYTCCHSFVHARVQNPGPPSLSNSSSLVLTSISCTRRCSDGAPQPPLPSCAPRPPWLRRQHARVTARSVMLFVICQLSWHYIMVALLVTCKA